MSLYGTSVVGNNRENGIAIGKIRRLEGAWSPGCSYDSAATTGTYPFHGH